MSEERDLKAWPGMDECIRFHGHLCPGLAIGFKAARALLAALRVERAEDEELFAIVETDACGADAIQVLSGCTFGKGNFLFTDHGKHAFTLGNRKNGRVFRACLKAGAFSVSPERQALFQKVQDGRATPDEMKAFKDGHLQSSRRILEMADGDLLDIKAVSFELPPNARMLRSGVCAECGEPVREDYLTIVDGRNLCPACSKRLEGQRA